VYEPVTSSSNHKRSTHSATVPPYYSIMGVSFFLNVTGVLLLTKETCGFTEIKAKGRDHLWCTLSFSLSVCLPVLTLWVITVSTVERYLLILIDKVNGMNSNAQQRRYYKSATHSLLSSLFYADTL